MNPQPGFSSISFLPFYFIVQLMKQRQKLEHNYGQQKQQ